MTKTDKQHYDFCYSANVMYCFFSLDTILNSLRNAVHTGLTSQWEPVQQKTIVILLHVKNTQKSLYLPLTS